MCDSPVQIKNINFAPRFEKHHSHADVRSNIGKFSAVKNPLDSYIYVPCGHCRACRTLAQLYMVQRSVEHAKGRWVIFGTATYSPEALPIYTLRFKNGATRDIPVADFDDFRLMVKRIRKSGEFPPFTYWITSEYGSDIKHGPKKSNHRPHYHYFIFVDRQPDDTLFEGQALAERWNDLFVREWRRNIAVNASGRRNTRAPVWLPLSRFIRATRRSRGTYDVHLLQEDSPNCAPEDPYYYATSYALGYDEWQEKYIQMSWYNCEYDVYKEFKKKFRTHVCCSKGFGISEDTETFVQECIDWSVANGLFYASYRFSDGRTLPLSRYFRNKYLRMRDYLKLRSADPESTIKTEDGDILCTTQKVPVFDRAKMFEIKNKNCKFERIKNQLREAHDVIMFDDE